MVHFSRDVKEFQPVSQGENSRPSSRSIADPRRGNAGRGGRRRAATCVALGCGVSAVVVLSRRAFGPCSPAREAKDSEPASLLELAESYPRDLMELGGHKPVEHADALAKWLSSANSAGELADNGDISQEWAAKAADAIDNSMNSDDPVEREKFVHRALLQAVEHSKEKRKILMKIFHGDVAKVAKASAFLAQLEAGGGGDAPAVPGEKSPAEQAQIASCVFDTLSITNIVASLGANINDMAQTCDEVGGSDFMDKENVHAKVCAVNSFAVIINFLSLATTLATAADTCALTIVPNMDAVCASAVTGLTTAVAQVGGSATLIASACTKDGWYTNVPEGVVPSNVGSNERFHQQMAGSKRRLAELVPLSELPDGSAPPRQLLFGGGKGSLATHCATEIMGTAWQIAYLGLNINSASNPKAGATCPQGSTPKEGIMGPLHVLREALCAADIGSALVSFFVIIVYLQLMAVTCTDELNLQAICGSGVTGLFAAMAGIMKASVGLEVACNVAQQPQLKPLMDLARLMEKLTGKDKISGILSGGAMSTPNFRRLSEELEFLKPEVEELKQRFATPAEVWASIGYDIKDPHAAFLQDQMKSIGSFNKKDVLALLEQPKSEATSSSIGLFEAVSGTCI